MNKSVAKNFVFAFVAQVVSLLASLVITFFASAMIGVHEFSYWQLFLTYVAYVSVTRLGLNDGLYLRFGGKNYDDLDYDLLSQERRIFIYFQIAISIILALLVSASTIEADRKFVLFACITCIIIVNANGYLIYVLQAVNLTSIYSKSVIFQNLTWFLSVILIWVLKIHSFKIIVVMYVLGHVLAGIYLTTKAWDIVRFRKAPFTIVKEDIKENIQCGIKLMISTYAGSFIISSCRLIVDAVWGVEVFGYFSFSLTLANVFLTFISQVSIVVFPALRKIDSNKILSVYRTLRDGLSIILPLVMLGYLPIVALVKIFLPQYSQSLMYLPVFLPICTFDGKMQMMCSSFFKSMRKEKTLLIINLCTLMISIIMALIGSLWVKNIEFVAFGILVVVALRSAFSEFLLAKWMNEKICKELIQEFAIVLIFVVGSYVMSPSTIFFVFLVVYCCYLIINKSKLQKLLVLRKKV